MKIHIYTRGQLHHASELLARAVEGFRRHGVEPEVMPTVAAQPCDLAVMWGVRNGRAMKSGRRCLILERGYVGDRFSWTSMGFDGLNGYADFCNEGMPGDRWEKHFAHCMQPWRSLEDGYVLIAGQVPNDASLKGLDTSRWCSQVEHRLRMSGVRTKIRWHPLARTVGMRPPRESLAEALAGAMWLVTYNSNAAVDAVLAGVPAVTRDLGGMAWPVTGHDLTAPPPMPDRTQWAHNLAYTQWSADEIASGEAWAHLAQGIEADARRTA